MASMTDLGAEVMKVGVNTMKKRQNSSEDGNESKRQQLSFADGERNVLATLVNLIPGKEQTIFVRDQEKTVIGRSRSCDIVVNEIDVSTKHCTLVAIEMNMAGGKRKLLNIVDSSRNGTFINGNKLVKKDCVLRNGDRIVLARNSSFLFKYVDSGDYDKANDDDMDQSNSNRASEQDDEKFKKPQSAFTNSQILVRQTQKANRAQSIFDKYIIGKELGSGHYAIVKEGTNKATGVRVAIKIFHPQLNGDEKKNRQFLEETNILKRVQHPNIVNLLDSFMEPVSKSQIQKYLVLDKIDDGELFDRIVAKTKLSQNETKALFKQILAGVKYLHDQNIIHRDIKPENILLNIKKRTSEDEIQTGPWDKDEIDIQIKIADFGLAKFTGEMQFTTTLCGTPSYVAPEVLKKKGYTSKVDIWSTGVLLYVCLCGFPPFSDQLGPPSLKEQILEGRFAFYSPYWDDIDDQALHLISNLLVVDPAQRYTIETMMQHPWFGINLQESVSTTMERLQLTGNRLPKTYSQLSCL